jgi:glycosyltransferase involved in cell wall biosynthesis
VRIALLHPTYWPEVRRGSERLVHDLGVALAGRGHEVTLVTSHRDRPSSVSEEGIRIRRAWRPPPLPGLDWYEDHVAHIPHVVWCLLDGGYDVAHALFPADAWGAARARRLGGPPYVFSVHGIVNREHLVGRRHRIEMFREAAAGAAVTSVLSEAAAAPFRRYALGDPQILPGGVVVADYQGPPQRTTDPTLLCPASLGDPRKRGELLLEAFGLLRERRAEARLVLAGGADPFARAAPFALPQGVETREIGSTVALSTAYRTAWATVLPAIDEAFGLVLLESLAAGTPVIAARSGACPEIVGEEAIGRLFAPDDAPDLARAMEEALELGAKADVVEPCRARAAEYDWSRLVELYEGAYEAAVANGGRP